MFAFSATYIVDILQARFGDICLNLGSTKSFVTETSQLYLQKELIGRFHAHFKDLIFSSVLSNFGLRGKF